MMIKKLLLVFMILNIVLSLLIIKNKSYEGYENVLDPGEYRYEVEKGFDEYLKKQKMT